MPRPKLPKSLKRSVLVFIALQPGEAEHLDAYKKRRGHKTRAAAIRHALRPVLKGAA